jgi:hypothetical protein
MSEITKKRVPSNKIGRETNSSQFVNGLVDHSAATDISIQNMTKPKNE